MQMGAAAEMGRADGRGPTVAEMLEDEDYGGEYEDDSGWEHSRQN